MTTAATPPTSGISDIANNGNEKSRIIQALETFFRNGNADVLAQALKNQGMETLIFDMDGTLINSESTNLAIVEDGLEQYGVTLNEAEKEEYVGTTIKSFCEMILKKRGIDQAEEKAAAISDSKDVKFPELLEQNRIEAFTKVIDLIKKLHDKGFKFALVTSSKHNIMQAVLDHFKLANYFQIKYGREAADDKLKPDPYIYKKALRNLETEPQKALIFEDSAPGIKSAHGARANVIVIKNLAEQNPQDIPSDNRIHRLDMTQFS